MSAKKETGARVTSASKPLSDGELSLRLTVEGNLESGPVYVTYLKGCSQDMFPNPEYAERFIERFRTDERFRMAIELGYEVEVDEPVPHIQAEDLAWFEENNS